MSDNYTVDGVTISPVGGGYYDLQLANGEPERVQGKEKAEARASEIAAANKPADGSMTAQDGTLDAGAQAIAQQLSDANVAGAQDNMRPAAQAPDLTGVGNLSDDEKANQIAALRAQLSALQGRNDDLESAAKGVVSVMAEDPKPSDTVPNNVPREYAGQMDPKAKAALAKAGISTTTIVLEENDSIPPTGLFLGHNGKSYMIKPGEEVDVPDFLLGVLNDAVMSVAMTDGTSKKVLGYRDRSKYPYRVIK
jgi:hypothetical protein